MGDTHQENTADPSVKRWYENPVYVVGGCVAAVIFALVVAFAIQSLMVRRAHQMAERAWVKVQGATIIGPLIQHNIQERPYSFTIPGALPHWRRTYVW